MSLSLELCKQLKAAGLPQGDLRGGGRNGSQMIIGSPLNDGDSPCYINREHAVCEGFILEGNEWYACYNSDELIAQIHAEWPNCVGFHCFTSCWDWWAAFELEVQRKPQEIVELQEGGTPHLAEALANLYIALKEQV